MSLEALLQRAKNGDSQALAAILDNYAARVFGLLYRLTGSQDSAEDLTQETFLRVARTIAEYDHVGRFEAWLFRIAANLARDRARRIRRRGLGVSLSSTADDEAEADPRLADVSRPDPSVLVEQMELGQRLGQCLERLNEADREIILLRHYSDMSFKDIADLLGIPLGTALARAHRALQRLREQLEP